MSLAFKEAESHRCSCELQSGLFQVFSFEEICNRLKLDIKIDEPFVQLKVVMESKHSTC